MSVPSWTSSKKSHIWIFNVGRGVSIFIRTALNQGIMYDCGSSDDFKPTEFLQNEIVPHLNRYKKHSLAQTIISHPHADHISNIECLVSPSGDRSPFHAALHTCPHSKTSGSAKDESLDWKRVNNPQGSDDKLKVYKSLYEGRTLPLQTICYDSSESIPNLEYGLYYVRPPVVGSLLPNNDQEYCNGVSLVIYYRHGIHTLLIPGDINPETMKHLLDTGEGLEKRYTIFDSQETMQHPKWHEISGDQPSLKFLLKKHGLSILTAPHHGLESGFSQELYNAMKDEKPGLVAISEKRHLSKTDGKVHSVYQSADGAQGQKVKIEGKEDTRYSVTTRDGHHILILFQGTNGKPEVFLEKDPMKLLKFLK